MGPTSPGKGFARSPRAFPQTCFSSGCGISRHFGGANPSSPPAPGTWGEAVGWEALKNEAPRSWQARPSCRAGRNGAKHPARTLENYPQSSERAETGSDLSVQHLAQGVLLQDWGPSELP